MQNRQLTKDRTKFLAPMGALFELFFGGGCAAAEKSECGQRVRASQNGLDALLLIFPVDKEIYRYTSENQ